MKVFKGYSTDRAAVSVFQQLRRDFRDVLGHDIGGDAEKCLLTNVKDFREYEWPALGRLPSIRFKAWRQLQLIFKRHRFENDAYTDKELEAKTVTSFVEAQSDFARPYSYKSTTFVVLQEARRVCKAVLSHVDPEELGMYVGIGKRATVGCSRHDAYIDHKLATPECFTCPTVLRKWFIQNYCKTDPVLRTLVRRLFAKSKEDGKKLPMNTDYLKLVNVPKNWKILRSITPLTLIGLFFSYGIGGLITEGLKQVGLDIATLQKQHKRLAARFSVTRSHVTVDLRRASDSVMSQHLNAVFPRVWYRLLRLTFVRKLVLPDESTMYNCSVLPMGNGATFPAETLFFYSLIRAVGNLLNVKGVYSVYGDDLIYPRRIHHVVVAVLEDLGIVVNNDKTCVVSHFRESCGGDYYCGADLENQPRIRHGIDVRPFMFTETTSTYLKPKRYAAWLYKTLNGLLARWDENEIPHTIRFLLSELAFTQREIYIVPRHFPATAGLKQYSWTGRSKEWYLPFAVPKIVNVDGSSYIRFKYLAEVKTGGKRYVVSEESYYWDKLRSMSLRKPVPWSTRLVLRSWLALLPAAEMKPGKTDFTIRRKFLKCDKKWVSYVPVKEGITLRTTNELVPISNWIQD